MFTWLWAWLSPQSPAQTATGAVPTLTGVAGAGLTINVSCGGCGCRCKRRLPAPVGIFRAKAKQEVGDMLLYGIDIQSVPPAAADVATRELHITVAGNPEIIQTVPVAQAEVEFYCNRGDAVAVYGVDIDADNNRSVPGALNAFIATDTIAPGAPGTFGVTLKDDNYTPPAPPTPPEEGDGGG